MFAAAAMRIDHGMRNTGTFPAIEFQVDATADASSFKLSLPMGKPMGAVAAQGAGRGGAGKVGREMMDGEAGVPFMEACV